MSRSGRLAARRYSPCGASVRLHSRRPCHSNGATDERVYESIHSLAFEGGRHSAAQRGRPRIAKRTCELQYLDHKRLGSLKVIVIRQQHGSDNAKRTRLICRSDNSSAAAAPRVSRPPLLPGPRGRIRAIPLRAAQARGCLHRCARGAAVAPGGAVVVPSVHAGERPGTATGSLQSEDRSKRPLHRRSTQPSRAPRECARRQVIARACALAYRPTIEGAASIPDASGPAIDGWAANGVYRAVLSRYDISVCLSTIRRSNLTAALEGQR